MYFITIIAVKNILIIWNLGNKIINLWNRSRIWRCIMLYCGQNVFAAFIQISTPGTYLILEFLGWELIEGGHLLNVLHIQTNIFMFSINKTI